MSRNAAVVRHVRFEDLGTLTPALAERGFDIQYLDAGIDKIGDEVMLDADLLIVLGGPISINDVDRYPFLADEARTIRAWLDYHLPILGICLGAQLIASALGADVTPMKGPEIGYAPLALTPAGERVLGGLELAPVLHWHGEGFALPKGTVQLASTALGHQQAFSMGPNVLALQPHLEADHLNIERWLIGHAHELAANNIDVDRIRRDAEAHGAELARAGRMVFGRWLDQIEDPF